MKIDKPTKFVIFNHSGVIGGAEKSNLALLNGINRKKYDPLVIFPIGQYEDFVKRVGVRYKALDLSLLRVRRITFYLSSLLRLYQEINREKPKFIYCNSIQSSQWGLPLGYMFRIPVVVHFRDWSVGLGSNFVLKIFKHYYAIANSEAVANKMEKEGFNGGQKLKVVYNSVDTSEFHPDGSDHKFRKNFRISEGDFLVGIIGRIDVWKGHEVLLAATGLLKDKLKNLKVVVVGSTDWVKDSSYLDDLKLNIKKLGLERRVIFTGFIGEIQMVLHGLDIVTVPSKNEPFGRLIIESMASGVPIIASDSGGIPELVENGKTGLLFKTGSAEDLAEKILTLYNDLALREEIKQNSLVKSKEFSPDKYVRALENCFGQVV